MLESAEPRISVTPGLARACWYALAATGIAAALLTALALHARAEPNAFEQERLQAEALESFQRTLRLWREELYFELYDRGMQSTRRRVGREAFAQRMVELRWVPAGELNPRHTSTTFKFRSMVYVTARITYRSKFNPDDTFDKRQTFLLLREDEAWHVDLIELLRAPYKG